MRRDLLPLLLDPARTARLTGLADLDPTVVADDFTTPGVAAELARAEVLFTFWGCPPLSPEVLAGAPRLRAVVHAAGSVRGFVTDACWERDIALSSAADANALPVAEYALAMILLANKRALTAREHYRAVRGRASWPHEYRAAGNYRRTVGVVGASRTGRRLIALLAPHDMEVLVHDPYLGAAEARALGARPAGLDELCARCDVVSLHAPELPETRHMIDERRLRLMPDGATLVNTARGALVDTDALTRELTGGRLNAVLDVTEPEIPPAGSPLWDLANVVLTPHIAGSLGGELHRLADSALDELERLAHGRPFAHPVVRERFERSA
ncbi:hydroxyacid dehydrogenase [Streptomyces malaysiense]|uniref:Hydroxyacid dehydrogenase n=1 Tax=Streptomyces malaysiense TaxID=1428626 RepID=A0A1J4Q5D8_9ACTN|nr:hydroxyacid dehydrogenase [Streptomyces malaysiense]OIK27764.1 hydroxyacid dehydrogenase [Streptomyces malaysiense]